MNIEELKLFLKEKEVSDYDRDTYDQAVEYLKFSFPIKSIHITGTNGKGSTANYLQNIYAASGLKVGLFNSPFLNDVTETISINGKQITDEDYLKTYLELEPCFKKFNLTAFEMMTLIAYRYFLDEKVDLAIIEVGMGGFIDATNIITPILSIITSVSLEHTMYLGRSVSEIAASKAGIIKYEVPVLVGRLNDENALFAIKDRAKRMSAPVHMVDEYHNEKLVDNLVKFDYLPFQNLEINTRSIYQCKNASLAIEATEILKEIIPVKEEDLRKGLKESCLPCRFEYVKPNIIVDGAHNPEAMESLVDTLTKVETRPVHVLFAVFRDKNFDSMLVTLQKEVSDITLTTFNHKRARTEEEFFLYLGDYEFKEDFRQALKELEEKYPDDVILVTGSLAFSGVVRKYLLEGE